MIWLVTAGIGVLAFSFGSLYGAFHAVEIRRSVSAVLGRA